MIKLAMEIAEKAHDGQKDKAGRNYLEHPLYLASKFEEEELKILALLHDVLEDTAMSREEIESYGFSKAVLDALDYLTKKEEDSYEDYILSLSENELARRVKIEDLRHNSDLSRLPKVTEKDQKRWEKYQKALEFLLTKE